MNLLLEGSNLEELLLRAAKTGGPGTRIVHAEKLRKGGVLGFFAREIFEVTIEVRPAPAPVDGHAAHAAMPQPELVSVQPPASLLVLAERASATQQASARMMALQARYLGLQPLPEDHAVQESWPVDGPLELVNSSPSPALTVNRLNERHDRADLAGVSEPFEPREPADHFGVEGAHDDDNLGYGLDDLTDVYRLDSAEPIGDEFSDFDDDPDAGDFSGEVSFHMDPVFADVPTPRLAAPIWFAPESADPGDAEPSAHPVGAVSDDDDSVTNAPVPAQPAHSEHAFAAIEFMSPMSSTGDSADDSAEAADSQHEGHPDSAPSPVFSAGDIAATLAEQSRPSSGRPQFTAMIDQLREGFRLGKHRLDGPRHTPDHPSVAETTGLPGNSAIFVAPGAEDSSQIEGAAWSSVIHPEGHSATATLEADRTMFTVTEPFAGSGNDSAGDTGSAPFGPESLAHSDNGVADESGARSSGGSVELPHALSLANARATTIVPSGKSRSRRGRGRNVPSQRPAIEDETFPELPLADPEDLAYTVNEDHAEEVDAAAEYAEPVAEVEPVADVEPAVEIEPELEPVAEVEPAFEVEPAAEVEPELEPVEEVEPELEPAAVLEPAVELELSADLEPIVQDLEPIAESLEREAIDSLADADLDPLPEELGDVSDELLGQPEPEDAQPEDAQADGAQPETRRRSGGWRMLRALRPRRRRQRDAEAGAENDAESVGTEAGAEELWTAETPSEHEALVDEHWMRSTDADFDYQIDENAGYELAFTSGPRTSGHWTDLQIERLQPPDFGEPGIFGRPALSGVAPAAPSDQLALDREALRTLGVPAAWTRHLQAGDRFASIVTLLERLPQLEIADDINVIAVIGPADVVELEAHRTALDLPAGGRPRAVAAVPESGSARRTAIAASKRTRPVVVAIAIEGYDDPADIRKVISQVRADSVIAVIDAGRPLEETTRWIEALEKVDAIALDGALDNARPAEVLNLEVPVIRVDGIAVDRIGWAALLCAQLAAIDAQRESSTW